MKCTVLPLMKKTNTQLYVKSVFESMKMYLSGMPVEHYVSMMCWWCMVDISAHSSVQRQFHPPSHPQNLYPYKLH